MIFHMVKISKLSPFLHFISSLTAIKKSEAALREERDALSLENTNLKSALENLNHKYQARLFISTTNVFSFSSNRIYRVVQRFRPLYRN